MNAAQLASYGRDGFVVVPDFLSAATCDALQARAAELVAGFDPGSRPCSTTRVPRRTSPSSTNRSSRPRRAYVLHLIDGQATYSVDNWLQRPDFPLRGFS